MLVGERLNRLYSKIEVEVLSVEPCKQVDIVHAEMQIGLQVPFSFDLLLLRKNFQLNRVQLELKLNAVEELRFSFVA